MKEEKETIETEEKQKTVETSGEKEESVPVEDPEEKTGEGSEETSEETTEESTDENAEDKDGEKVIPPLPDTASAAKAATDLNQAARQQLRLDKTYKAGRIIYKVGIGLLLALLAANAVMYLMNIELFINGAYSTWLTFYMYVIPCAVMFTGLILSAVSAKKHGVTDNDGLGIAFVTIGACLMIGLGTVQMLSPSYRIYETQDVTIRDGEPLKIVKYIPTGIFEPKLQKLPGEYCMDIYRVDGIFCKKIFSKDISFSSYVIYPDEDKDGGYLIGITSLGSEEIVPFSYR